MSIKYRALMLASYLVVMSSCADQITNVDDIIGSN